MWFTFSLELGAYGLAIAQAIVAVLEVIILFVVMELRMRGILNRSFWSAILRMASSAGFMSVICYLMVSTFPLGAEDRTFFSSLPKFALIVIVSLSSYLLFSQLFMLSEAKPVLRRIERIFFKL